MDSNHSANCDNPHNDDIEFDLCGKYSIQLTENLTQKAIRGEDIYPQWKTNMNGVKNSNYKFRLHPCLINAVIRRVNDIVDNESMPNVNYNVQGFTRLTTISHDGNQVVYHANPHLQGRMWYDWAYVHFEETDSNGAVTERYYPAKILGFVNLDKTTEAVIHCTDKPLSWSSVEKHFMVKVNLGQDETVSVVTVPLTSFVHPLCVVPDYGGNVSSYIVVLPRRNWSRYFADQIVLE